MEYNEIIKKTFEYNRKGFETIFEAAEKAQTKAEEYTGQALEKAPFVSEQGRGHVTKWIEAARKARADFREAVLKGFAQCESYLTPA